MAAQLWDQVCHALNRLTNDQSVCALIRLLHGTHFRLLPTDDSESLTSSPSLACFHCVAVVVCHARIRSFLHCVTQARNH